MTDNMHVWARHSRPCALTCLGPLTFHPGAVGKKVTLSHGNCRASRDLETFHDGLVFSSRPVNPKEKVQIKVERSLSAWQGAVRVGFTNVCPTTRPLPPLAIPDLTDRPGYCARPVPHSYCPPGTTITFWMTRKGHMGYKTSTGRREYTHTDLDFTLPLWAFIDVYGQSTTVLLLGSVRRTCMGMVMRKSCPVPHSLFQCGYEDTPALLKRKIEMAQKKSKPSQEDQSNNDNHWRTESRSEDLCSVCQDREASLALRCGHRCLCLPCANRVFAEFGTCPLCRQSV
ncbi:E3 ubiquitin-protein ligase NEURL3-like [Clupea harengus]|uniref:E3 ubiquitin-protein ligase NEURL3-like n=1 Tax=Clupea harengus TaxID=7950 RepID=A0A6P8G0I4_CLUHA|nr:E3 ubiquitin-protein ligase NEURL3-like [Clupea harengus]